MTVRVWTQDSPVGPLVVAEGDAGVARVALRATVSDVASDLKGEVEILRRRPADGVAAELDRYFDGRLRAFEAPLDLSAVGGFHREVLETLRHDVAYGEVVTYGELAELAGRPGAARAVGAAMHRNPVFVIVPCHRVVAASGIGGYGLHLDVKRWLLAREGVEPAAVSG